MTTESNRDYGTKGGNIDRDLHQLCGDIIKIVTFGEKIIESASTGRLDTVSEQCGSYNLGITALSGLKTVLGALEQGGQDVSDAQQAVDAALGELHSKSESLGCG